MFDGHLRSITDRGVKPIGNALSRLGVTPDQLTVVGLVMAIATAVSIGSGRLFLGFLLLVASALPDLFDGAVAKASGSSSVRGAFFDSVADRVTDALLLGGIAWHLQNEKGGHYAMLAFAVLAVSTLISYQRAKAEIFGFDAKGGLMERAERIIVICVGLVFSALLVPVLWLMLALTSLTAVQRFVKVWRQAGKPPVPVAPPARTRAVRSARQRRTRTDRQTWSARREHPNRSSSLFTRSSTRATESRRGSRRSSASLREEWRQRRGERVASRDKQRDS